MLRADKLNVGNGPRPMDTSFIAAEFSSPDHRAASLFVGCHLFPPDSNFFADPCWYGHHLAVGVGTNA
jgi:hypothetical protein